MLDGNVHGLECTAAARTKNICGKKSVQEKTGVEAVTEKNVNTSFECV